MKAVLQRGLNQKANAHSVEHQFLVHIPNLKNKTLRPSMISFFGLRIIFFNPFTFGREIRSRAQICS